MHKTKAHIHYTQLILYKTYADLKAETKKTYLGFLWWIFEPIMYMSVFYVIFGVLMQRGTEDFVPFLLVGLTIWQWTKSCISHGANTISGSRHLMQRVHLPKVIFPLILILTDTVKFLFIFILLIIFLWLSGFPINQYYAFLPLLLFTQLLFTTGITLLHASLVPFMPDFRFVVENLLHAVFFLSGIFFAADAIPEEYHFYFYLNPMATLIEEYRQILLYQAMPSLLGLSVILGVSLLLIALSTYIIRRFDHIYPRINA